jgi:N-acetyl-gamma-glutamyl-phosphate reductase
MKSVGIIGASGYTGHELTKLLRKHSLVELKVLNSKHHVGQKIRSLYPDYDGDESYSGFSIDEINELSLDIVFLALPHAQSMDTTQEINTEHTRIIDLSADYRFKDAEMYEKVYGRSQHKTSFEWVYGLPELFRDDIRTARGVANPGCFAIASILATYPIQDLARHIVLDCKSGWSGAGKNSVYAKDPDVIHDNLIAYNLTRHRHKYEIEQFIQAPLSFTPHVIDTYQGLMCTAHILLDKTISEEEVRDRYKKLYGDAAFVRITETVPQIAETRATNYCDIGGFEIDETNQLVVVATLDNLWKGAAGQAVQNMNIMCDFAETEGLI